MLGNEGADTSAAPTKAASGWPARVTQEVTELQGLFDLFEEDFDRPATLVESANARSGLFHIVGDENHLDLFAVHFDPRNDPSHTARVIGF